MSHFGEIRRSPTGRHALRTDRYTRSGQAWTALDDGEFLRPQDVEGWKVIGPVQQLIDQKEELLKLCDLRDTSRPRIMGGYLPAAVTTPEIRALLLHGEAAEDVA